MIKSRKVRIEAESRSPTVSEQVYAYEDAMRQLNSLLAGKSHLILRW
jgi:hypothetical protein